MPHVVTAPSAVRFTGRGGLVDRYFYFFAALLTAVIVVWGFSHTVGDNLLHAPVPRPIVLWAHAAAFCLWVILYVGQTGLIRAHRVSWHRTLGWFGAGLGAVMVPLGVMTALTMGHYRAVLLHEADAMLFEIVSFFDMSVFAVMFGLAIYFRRKRDLHRRLIFLATCGLLAAAFGRFEAIFNHNLMYVFVDAMILLGVVRDLVVERSVHPVYRVALPALVVGQAFTIYVVLHNPAWWVKTAHWMMA